MIYLASPYSHDNPAVREQRYRETRDAVAVMLQAGSKVISPIVHCHSLDITYDMPKDAAFWREYDHALLDACSEVWVLRLDGWDNSVGVKDEIDYAHEQGKEVTYLSPGPFTPPAKQTWYTIPLPEKLHTPARSQYRPAAQHNTATPKRRWELMPWNAVARVADVFGYGATKYRSDGWRNVADWRARYFAALMRHVTAWWEGEQCEPESGLPHLAHAACDALILLARDTAA